MIGAEFVGGPWCGDHSALPEIVPTIAIFGCDVGEGWPLPGQTPDDVPSSYCAGHYELRPGQTHAGPYWYDWRPA